MREKFEISVRKNKNNRGSARFYWFLLKKKCKQRVAFNLPHIAPRSGCVFVGVCVRGWGVRYPRFTMCDQIKCGNGPKFTRKQRRCIKNGGDFSSFNLMKKAFRVKQKSNVRRPA